MVHFLHVFPTLTAAAPLDIGRHGQTPQLTHFGNCWRIQRFQRFGGLRWVHLLQSDHNLFLFWIFSSCAWACICNKERNNNLFFSLKSIDVNILYKNAQTLWLGKAFQSFRIRITRSQGINRLVQLSILCSYKWKVKSLSPDDAICCQRTWSTLVQVMARCCYATSHYLHQLYPIIAKTLWHSPQGNLVEILNKQHTILGLRNQHWVNISSGNG